jgi:hypothetical protein
VDLVRTIRAGLGLAGMAVAGLAIGLDSVPLIWVAIGLLGFSVLLRVVSAVRARRRRAQS